MAVTLNFFDTYILLAIMEEVVPNTFFFRDRYFPTGEGDIFAADKVLTEYRRGDRKMAAFVSERIGDIPMDRIGYEIPAADRGRAEKAWLWRGALRQLHPRPAGCPAPAR